MKKFWRLLFHSHHIDDPFQIVGKESKPQLTCGFFDALT